MPVTFPPGRARLVTIPYKTGSAVDPTIGIVVVASLSSFTNRDEKARITSGPDLMAEVTTRELRCAFPTLEKRRTTRFSPST
jgi:hypothetical protein